MRFLLSAIIIFFTLGLVIFLLWRQRTKHIAYVHANLEGYWDSSKEKRRFKRFKVSLPVDCIVPEKPGDVYKTFSRDVSGTGICISVPEIMPESSRVRLRVCLPNNQQVSLAGEIVWVKEAEPTPANNGRVFNAGIRFVDMDKRGKGIFDSFLIDCAR
jgi:hypothetical protein